MNVLTKVIAAAVAGSVLGLVVKKNNPEASLMLTVALTAFALYLALGIVTEVLDFIKTLSELAGLAPAVLSVVLKTVGIAVITKLASDVCRDAGQSSAASGVELTGAVSAVYVALPLFKTVISMINSLV